MKYLIAILLVSITSFAQEIVTDTIQPNIQPLELDQTSENIYTSTTTIENKPEIYSDSQLNYLDSLFVNAKFSSNKLDDQSYVLNDSNLISNIEPIITTEELKARLEEINATTPFNIAYNPALEKVINNYIKYRKKYYPALFARAKYYFPIFEQYLDQFDIPIEMKYLAIVESALHPKAKSRVGATGLWQFMYGTGKQFKLAVNSYVDERQDPIKSTIAACKFLNQLYDIFGDWDLALAGYNSGPGNVLKAIKRSGGYRNYWNIRPYLPYETAGYVPAFYATMYIFKYANELGMHSDYPEFYDFETDTIQVKKMVSFNHISQKTGIKTEVLQLLNPKYKIDVIPYVKNKLFSVRIPRNKMIDFLDKEEEIYALATAEEATREKPLPKYFEMDKRIRYRVKNGDYLGKIARKFGVKINQIKRWNNMRNTKLSIGQRLYIYPRRM